jgi:hypothetical protein
MSDQFLPGWHLPPGTWPYSIQFMLQAALQPTVPPKDADAQSAVSAAKPPSGGLLGVFAGQNAPWDLGTSGLPSAVMPSTHGGLLGSLAPPDDGWRSDAPHWLQTALAFGLDLGSRLPSNNPPQAPAPFTSTTPTLSNLPALSLANLDPSSLSWLQTVLPAGENGSGLPLSTPPVNAPPDVPLQQAPVAMWDSANLPIPPALPPVFLTAPPSGDWNEGGPSLSEVLAGSNAELPAPPAASDLASVAARGIPAAPLTPGASDHGHRPGDAIITALAQPRGAAAVASPLESLGRPQAWPAPPRRYPGDVPWTRGGVEAQSDPRIISDVTPDNDWTPGARYANKSPGRGSGPIRIGQRLVEPEPGQAVRLFEAETRAEQAMARVRELDPGWRPRPSAYESIEGLIRARESEAEQAQTRLRELARLQFSSTIPKERPPTAKERNEAAREIARWLVKNHEQVVEGVSWLFELEPMIEAYLDEPKTMEELRQAVSNPKPGYDIHHIVEKMSAEEDGFPKSMIHGPDNLVRIPRFKHWEITGWYMTKNKDYRGLSPREHLRGRAWADRIGIGLDALILHGVLKP